MEEIRLRKGEEFIRLGQALKLCGEAESGAFAKTIISEGLITVNGEVEQRRGRKLYDGDIFCYEGNEYQVHGT